MKYPEFGEQYGIIIRFDGEFDTWVGYRTFKDRTDFITFKLKFESFYPQTKEEEEAGSYEIEDNEIIFFAWRIA
jgi:hypothetical protein